MCVLWEDIGKCASHGQLLGLLGVPYLPRQSRTEGHASGKQGVDENDAEVPSAAEVAGQ